MRKWLHRGGFAVAATVLALSVSPGSAAAETLTGCLEKASGGFALNASGKRLTVTGDLDFAKHAGHTVKLTGEESGNSFRATALDHVSPTCDGSANASPASAAAANRPTASDQGNSEADVEMTAKIRRAIVEDENLSTLAHNVTIITRDGKVTLRGDVNSAEEKSAVAAKAAAVAGATVDDQLAVKADPESRPKRGEK